MFGIDELLGCLEVEEVRTDVWTGPNLPLDYRRIFGGQLLAQAIAIAARSTPGKAVKSLSCVFPREGDPDQPLELELERIHDGRTFATRRILASQAGKPFFVATLSMAVAEDGPDAQVPMPDAALPREPEEPQGMIPFEYRVVDGVDLTDPAQGTPELRYFTRVASRGLADDPSLHQGLLAYVTDLSVIGTALRPVEGYSQADSTTRLHTAVTTHHLWFHRPFRFDEWVLVDQRSPVVAGARGFGTGDAFAHASGALVASFAQESMIRPI